jgi:hypothetical protein
MSLKNEQYESLKRTQQFLYDLLDSKKRPKNVKELKDRTLSCLRHFPMLDKEGKPFFSKF